SRPFFPSSVVPPPYSTPLPYTTLFRSILQDAFCVAEREVLLQRRFVRVERDQDRIRDIVRVDQFDVAVGKTETAQGDCAAWFRALQSHDWCYLSGLEQVFFRLLDTVSVDCFEGSGEVFTDFDEDRVAQVR